MLIQNLLHDDPGTYPDHSSVVADQAKGSVCKNIMEDMQFESHEPTSRHDRDHEAIHAHNGR